jgi:rhamnosyltransferase subunit B
MSRIVLTTIGSFGDLHPKIAIALELRHRGHDVVFATHREYQDKIEALGFEFHRMRPDNTALNDAEEMSRMMDLRTGTEYVIRNWVCASLRETYADLMNAAKNADLIIHGEGVLAARLAAEKLGIPWVLTILQPLAFVSQLRQDIGLPPLKGNPFIDDKYSPDLVLAMFSSILAKPQPDWAANTVLTGFTFYDGGSAPLSPELDQFLHAGEPPIVFTLGSAAVVAPGQFYEESIKAAQRLNRRAVLLMGKNAPPDNLADSMIAVNYAPYSQIFSRSCAIVHQGGIGTTAQALRAGRPTLVTPYSIDQPDNAARVERLGTSRTVARKQYSAERVAKQLGELLENPSYTARASEVKAILQTEDGVNVACDAIEKRLKAI